jgi:hypothetical protein
LKNRLVRIFRLFDIFCILILSSSFIDLNINKVDLIGKYKRSVCFRINECVVSKLTIKKNHTYAIMYIGNNHGRKSKSTEKGTWIINGDIITFKELKSSDKEVFQEQDTYKLYKGDLWYYSKRTLELDKVAFEKQ